ncbi:MAG: hypothetical protein FJY92_10765 [Candidatus Hydrogenedentes bacterium]|nr:hypothetical protein [Candidatus Hydrogenedentota bacterium]
MFDVNLCNLDDAPALARMCAALRGAQPDLVIDRIELDGEEAELRAAHAGTRVFWLYRGEGEVFLPDGFRTKEGDGHALPRAYTREPMNRAFAEVLDTLRANAESVRAEARPALDAVLSRQRGATYVGDNANDLWKLEHVARPWSGDAAVERALESLWTHGGGAGHSSKTGASFERIIEGDQLAVTGSQTLRVRGTFACLTIENPGARDGIIPSAMRLRYLRDSSGGCNFDFDPFRRLPLTWRMTHPGERGDGTNWVNSHVVNIAKETSPSHFHPPTATGGGKPQHEFYLVLDPAAYGLNTHGRRAQLYTWPDLRRLDRMVPYDLRPGDFVHIPPGVGHRGIDVFVNVITVPGFKPHNEYYLDADLRDRGAGVPFNGDLAGLKNYARLEGLLDSDQDAVAEIE